MKLFKYLSLALLLVSAISCGSSSPSKSSAYELTYKPRYATRFEIGVSGDTTILVIRDPWQGASNVRHEYRFTTPHTRIIAMSSSHTAFLEALDAGDNVVGVSGREFLHSPQMQTKEDVGYDRNLAYEKIVSLRPDAMTVYEVSGENSSITQKLTQLGVPIIYISDYLESDPLGRAEWVVALGALVGKQKEAELLFDSIADRYNTLATRFDMSSTKRPKVMLNSPYRDVWYMPGDSNYMVRLLRDAGADYLGAGEASDASRPISIESAYAMLLKADFWLNPSMGITTRAQLFELNKNFHNIKARLYSNTARSTVAGGSDFWESGVIKPDVILSDLIAIFHPELLPHYQGYYFEELH